MSTATLSSDAISVTLQPGAAARMVTEYMPGDPGAQVINTAATGTIYLGTSSSVQPSNGVPLPAGSSVQWVNEGQLWAIAGSDAIGPILLVATSCISSWAPSPEIIALTVAAQLLATGIPNVLLSRTLLNAAAVSPAGVAVSVGAYATAIVKLTNSDGVTPKTCAYAYKDSVSGATVAAGILSCVGVAAFTNDPTWELPVSADTLVLTNVTGGAILATVLGTNRAGERRMLGDWTGLRTLACNVPGNAVVGTVVAMTDTASPLGIMHPGLTAFNGAVMYEWATSTNAVGNYEFLTADAAGAITANILFQNPSTTIQRILLGHPGAFVSWQFRVTVQQAPAYTPWLSLIPANPV